ncbi:MAG: glycoside hydrolase family 15 protein [Bacillota bacterium]
MARALVVGNGRLLVNFDERLVMRELYFPHVGMVNHIEGDRNVAGIWVDGSFDWLNSDGWERALGYSEDSLVTHCEARHRDLRVQVTINDAVHYQENVLLRKFTVTNLALDNREIRLFLPSDFHIDETDVGDTAFYDPEHDALIHFKRKRCFLFSGRMENRGLFQYSTGRKRFFGAEGTWRDAEDGILEGNPIAQGAVDSVASFRAEVPGGQSVTAYCWLTVGDGFEEITQLHHLVVERDPAVLMDETDGYWRHWVDPSGRDYAGLPSEVVAAFRRSLLVIRTQVDWAGGILAANDTDILQTNRDHYSYIWPRDGALVAQAMDLAGYPHVARDFFGFCRRAITRGGYFWHKYNPDASMGSSWHPWILRGRRQLPIQEDETALVILALGDYHQKERDLEYVASLYPTLVKPAAEFMVAYRDASHLPLPSYDLWEERRGVFTFTAVAVCRALETAAAFGALLRDRAHLAYAQAAAEVRQAVLEHLYRPDLGRFVRGLYPVEANGWEYDLTLESSTLGVALMGFLPPGDPRVAGTARAVESGLWVNTSVGGLARYTGDYYFRRSDDLEQVPGNPWIVCTLWLADWHIIRASKKEDLQFPARLLQWAARHATGSGILSEQLDPFTGAPLSVSPLTWSHAALVGTTMRYIRKHEEMRLKAGV